MASLANTISIGLGDGFSLPGPRRILAGKRLGPAANTRGVTNTPGDSSQRGTASVERFGVTPVEDLVLVQQCMAGDAEAWQRLVVYQHRRVYAICYRFTGSPTDAEDLTQDVFLKLYRNLQAFDGSKGSLQTWITTLTRNLLVDHFRRSRHDRMTGSLDAGWDEQEEGPTGTERLADTASPSQFDQVARQEVQARVQAGLQQLSPELREAVVLRDLEDMDYKEIAAVLNIPEGTVKSRISRGRAELARVLERTHHQGRN